MHEGQGRAGHGNPTEEGRGDQSHRRQPLVRDRSIETVEPVKPKLLFLFSSRSGRSRLIDGYLAQVLQHRHNHDTFILLRIDVDERPELAERLAVTKVPTLLVVTERRVRARLCDPKGRAEITKVLSPWLK